MKKVLLFLPKGFEEYETFSLREAFKYSEIYSPEDEKLILKTTGLRNEVISAWNAVIKIDCALDEITVTNFECLLIPGGFEESGYYIHLFDEKVIRLIKAFHAADKLVVSVCVGSLALGKSGIVKNRKATTYCSEKRKSQLAESGAVITDDKIVVDGNIITSNSPATALDVAFLVIEKLTSKSNKDLIKREIGFS